MSLATYAVIAAVIFVVSHVVAVVLQNRDKTERIYMNASEVPNFCRGMIIDGHGYAGVFLVKVIHTSVSDSCITVRPLHWWERLLHWLKGLL